MKDLDTDELDWLHTQTMPDDIWRLDEDGDVYAETSAGDFGFVAEFAKRTNAEFVVAIHNQYPQLLSRLKHLEMLVKIYQRPQILRGEDFAEFRGVLAATFFYAVAAELDKHEATNFITFKVASGDGVSPYWCTVRRDDGETPEEQNRRLREELAERNNEVVLLSEKIDLLRDALKQANETAELPGPYHERKNRPEFRAMCEYKRRLLG